MNNNQEKIKPTPQGEPGGCASVERMELPALAGAMKCELGFIQPTPSGQPEASQLVLIKKAYKYRIYPNKAQRAFLNQTMGCCRWLWNYALGVLKENDEKKYKAIILAKEKKGQDLSKEEMKDISAAYPLSIYDISKQIPELKNKAETSFLKSAISISLIQTLRNLDMAHSNYFRNLKNGTIAKMKADYIRYKKQNGGDINERRLHDIGSPQFKARGHRQSCSFHQAYSIDFVKGVINIPKCPGVKIKLHRKYAGTPKTVTIEHTPSGKYFASILVNEMLSIPDKKPINEKTTIGLHQGIKNLITADEETIIYRRFRFLKARLRTLKIMSKRLSRKKEKSNRWNKQRIRVAKLYEHITNQRNYLLHELANEIIRNPAYNTIAAENWDKKEMMRNPIFAQAIADVSWERLLNFIKYKCEWNGKNYIELAPITPNAKTCNSCGHVNEWVELKHRDWKCEKCGAEHKREDNAAKNTKKMSLKRNKHKGSK